jgi:mycothiol synthase
MSAPPSHRDLLNARGRDGEIVRVEPRQVPAAIERLVSGRGSMAKAQADRFLAFAQAQGIRLDKVWARVGPEGAFESTVVAIANPGRTAVMFATACRTSDDVEPLAKLIDAACQGLSGGDLDLAQVLLEPHEHDLAQAYRLGGFEDLARLSYLERPLRARPGRPPPIIEWPAGVEVRPYDPETMHAAMCRVLDLSYEGTLDCPGLRGKRRTADILAGHQGTGAFEPALWTMLYRDGEPAGALLLNPAPASRSVELVYIGLGPAVRGMGLGRLLLRHGLSLLRTRSERTLTLAVDDENKPAFALYRSEGFRTVLRRLALIRPLRFASS